MPIPVEDLSAEESIDIESQILNLFEQHKEEALSFTEITNGVFDVYPPYGTNFDIEAVRFWMPMNQSFIFGNLRQVYYRLSIIGTALTTLLSAGKLKSRSIKNPKPHKVEWSPPFVTYYFLP